MKSSRLAKLLIFFITAILLSGCVVEDRGGHFDHPGEQQGHEHDHDHDHDGDRQ
jgi:hypothetical protein